MPFARSSRSAGGWRSVFVRKERRDPPLQKLVLSLDPVELLLLPVQDFAQLLKEVLLVGQRDLQLYDPFLDLGHARRLPQGHDYEPGRRACLGHQQEGPGFPSMVVKWRRTEQCTGQCVYSRLERSSRTSPS